VKYTTHDKNKLPLVKRQCHNINRNINS